MRLLGALARLFHEVANEPHHKEYDDEYNLAPVHESVDWRAECPLKVRWRLDL